MPELIAIHEWFNESRFNSFHFTFSALCLGIVTLDGYNLFIYAGALPLVMEEFQLSPTQAGGIASYSLIGFSIGALVLGSLADKIGRKNALIGYMTLFSAGMFLAGLAHSAATLGLFLFITNLGVGGSLVNVT